MGGSSFSKTDYDSRTSYRAKTGASAFVYDASIKSGTAAAKIHEKMDPSGVKFRECRDSPEHPVTVPVGVAMDLTGSMDEVPKIFQKALPKLMGYFLEDKASGKHYLGEGYPAIMIAGLDDFNAMTGWNASHGVPENGAKGTIQVGQFESGLEIDDDLGRLWLTGMGGGTREEDYDLMLYFYARHTVHDHYEKRGKKGFLFLFGDEKPYGVIRADRVKEIFGDDLTEDIRVQDIIAEVQERYHVFFVLPNLTSYYNVAEHQTIWEKLVGKENFRKLEDPQKICELIVSIVALFEENASLDDLMADGVATGLDLVPLAKKLGEVSRYDAGGLPPVATAGSGTERM